MQTNQRLGFDIVILNPQLMKKLQIGFIQKNEGVILRLPLDLGWLIVASRMIQALKTGISGIFHAIKHGTSCSHFFILPTFIQLLKREL